ncbi:hypothetical protein HID58_070386, partial [Brassica napus]
IRKESRNVPNPLEKSFKIYSKTPAEPSFILSEFLSNRRLWSLKQRRKYRLSGGTMDPPPISLNSRHVGNLCVIQVSCFVHCSKHSNRNFLTCVHRSSIWMLRPPLFVLFFPSGDAPLLFLISAKSSSYCSPTVYFIVSDYGDEATGSTIHSTVQRQMVDLVIGQLEEAESSSKLPLKLLAWEKLKGDLVNRLKGDLGFGRWKNQKLKCQRVTISRLRILTVLSRHPQPSNR